ncbi:MAG: hydroxymethylbilane synthase [Chloroflexi bacterium]|nr:hydroxymethylbilane synthase [Chloroflexota bacterium]
MAINVGTRGSPLALWQAQETIRAIRAHFPAVECEIVIVRTEGDRNRIDSLATLGGRGVFVRDIEDRLLNGEFDLAVHSLKDLPATQPAGLVLAAITERADMRDALVTRDGAPLSGLRNGAIVGSSSQRRSAQLLAMRPDLVVASIRGNVETRLRKLDEGQYEAVVLAAAGLIRLGLAGRISQYFGADEMLPAAGQGALGIECRADDTSTRNMLHAALENAPMRAAADAERAFLRALGAGCTLPVGAYATCAGDTVTLRGLIARPDGQQIVRGACDGPIASAEALGAQLAAQLLAAGGRALMETAHDRAPSA